MPERRDLFLFDVDGVLIYPKGYKEALRASVDYFGLLMGQPIIDLMYEEIAVFEACNITNEWDSLVMCVGAMLIDAALRNPNIVRDTFLDTVTAVREAEMLIARPEFRSIARVSTSRYGADRPVANALLAAQKDVAPPPLFPVLEEIFGNVYTLDGPTTRIFQHYSLGHERFRQTYGIEPYFNTEGLLAKFDAPHITPATQERLFAYAAGGLAASYGPAGMAIFTARPSLPPIDLPPEQAGTVNHLDHPPEGDLAAEVLGWLGKVPLIAGGRMVWIAHRDGKARTAYHKPSPVQALAAIGAAYSGGEYEALEAAIRLFRDQELSGPLAAMRDGAYRVVVFEDSTGGIRSGQEAVTLLRESGLDVTFESVGIAPELSKKDALRQITGLVVDDINQALDRYLPAL